MKLNIKARLVRKHDNKDDLVIALDNSVRRSCLESKGASSSQFVKIATITVVRRHGVRFRLGHPAPPYHSIIFHHHQPISCIHLIIHHITIHHIHFSRIIFHPPYHQRKSHPSTHFMYPSSYHSSYHSSPPFFLSSIVSLKENFLLIFISIIFTIISSLFEPYPMPPHRI